MGSNPELLGMNKLMKTHLFKRIIPLLCVFANFTMISDHSRKDSHDVSQVVRVVENQPDVNRRR